jgi:hypothetical protein
VLSPQLDLVSVMERDRIRVLKMDTGNGPSDRDKLGRCVQGAHFCHGMPANALKNTSMTPCTTCMPVAGLDGSDTCLLSRCES